MHEGAHPQTCETDGVRESRILSVGELGSVPVATKIDDSDAVVWRTANGDIGVAARSCPHLDWDLCDAIVDGEALLCPGHGWSIDKSGRTYKSNEFGREDEKGTTPSWSASEREGGIWVTLDED